MLSVADAHSLALVQHFFKLDLRASDISAPEWLQDFFVLFKSLTSPVQSPCDPRPTQAFKPFCAISVSYYYSFSFFTSSCAGM